MILSFLPRVGFQKPKCFALNKSVFHTWSVTGREMRVFVSVGLKCVRMSKIESWLKSLVFKDGGV